MPRKQTFQCPGCLTVYKDNYALNRHLNRKVPCTGRPSRVAQRINAQPPRRKIRKQDMKQHFDEVQRVQQQVDDEPLTEEDLEQLEQVFRQTGEHLRRASMKNGKVDPALDDLINLNTSMVSLMAEAQRRGDQPAIDDIQELAKLFYDEIMNENPDMDPNDAIQQAVVAAQNVISEQLNAYQMGYAAQKEPVVDQSVYYDRLLRYYEIRTQLGMQAWQHEWALTFGVGTSALAGSIFYFVGEPFTWLANWFQTVTPFVSWETINLPFLGHMPLGGLLSWLSSVTSAASNFMVHALTALCQHLSGIAFVGQVSVSLVLGVLAFTIAHLYLRFVHTRKVKVGVVGLVDLQLDN